MELLQIIESSVFLFSLFGIFLLLISFASYRMKRNNGKLMLQTIRQNSPAAAQSIIHNTASIENVRFVNGNLFPTKRFIILNVNPIVTNNARKENVLFKYPHIDIQSEEYKRLRPAKFYSLEELK